MNNVSLDFEVDISAPMRDLKKMTDRADDQRPVLEHARDVLKLANERNFASNGLPVGGWAPLDAEYGSWKSANFPGAPPMVQTGRLFRELTSLRGPGNVIGQNTATFGTRLKYAKFHQYGTTKMAKRLIIFQPRGFADDLAEYSRRYIIDGETVASTFG